MGQFPLLTLQDILFSKNFNEKKNQVYIKQCEKHNILWIQGIISQIYRLLLGLKIDIKAKLHAIYLLKEIVKTCQYSVLSLVQAYFLNFLEQACQFYSENTEFQKNCKYFQNAGHSYCQNIEQLSHNYIILAWQILYLCAKIRPKQTFYGLQMRKDSGFQTILMKIKQKNPQILNEKQMQRVCCIPELRQKYKKQLEDIQNNSYFYIDYYMNKLQSWVFSNDLNKPKEKVLDLKILLKKGDVMLTSQGIARLLQLMDFVEDFKIKARALSLLHQMILWGEIEAVITVNYTDYLEKIFQELFKVDGSKGLKKGQQIFTEIQGQLEQKKIFYCEFLRCIQCWSQAFPTEQKIFNGEIEQQTVSPIFKNYRFLRDVRKFVFPQNPFYQKIQTQISLNFRINQQRNKLILTQFMKQFEKTENPKKVSLHQITEMLQKNQQHLQNLRNQKFKESGRGIDKVFKDLAQFSDSFELKLQRINQNFEENDLDKMIEKGFIFVEIIHQLQHQYQKTKKDKLSFKNFLAFCSSKIDLSGKNIDKSRFSNSIIDKKSQIKSNITNSIRKSVKSFQGMTDEARSKLIKIKYLERLQKLANRTNSVKDDSFLNTSGFLSTKKSGNQKFLWNKQSPKIKRKIYDNQKQWNQNIRLVKSNDKNYLVAAKSPRQTGKKVFLVSKYLQNSQPLNVQNIKNQIIEKNWNTNKNAILQSKKINQPEIYQKLPQFSFLDQMQSKNLNAQQSKMQSGQLKKQCQSKLRKLLQPRDQVLIKQDDQRQVFMKNLSNEGMSSPKFGNTEIKESSSNQSRKRFRGKGVGLAKQFVNFTQKLIGPKKQLVSFSDFQEYFPYRKDIKQKKDILSKQIIVISNDLINIDRLTIMTDHRLTITFFLFPKSQCSRLRFKILEKPSIYLNVTQSQNIRIQKSYYEITCLKPGEQYSFELIGYILKTPIMMPQIQIRINEEKGQNFVVPFPLIHMLKFNKPQTKWLGKQFDLADKVISEEFQRNTQMLAKLSDLEDYISDLTQIKSDKNLKRYRTQATLDHTSFILQFKEVDTKVSISACLLSQKSQKGVVQYLIAQLMNLFC